MKRFDLPSSFVREACCLCGSPKLIPLWDLTNFPFTDTIGQYEIEYPTVSQTLVICSDCEMVQLLIVVDPEFLYSALNYSYDRPDGEKIVSESLCYRELLNEFIPKIRKNTIHLLEIGGSSDLFLNKISDLFDIGIIIDPVPRLSTLNNPKISFVSGFMENNFDLILENKVNVIVCRHVIEHVKNPVEFMTSLIDNVNSDGLLIFETPNFNSLIEKSRFDAIFHQHVNYFNPKTFRLLIEKSGGEVLKEIVLDSGSNGGVMIFIIRKMESKFDIVKEFGTDIDSTSMIEKFTLELSHFENSMIEIGTILDSLRGDFYCIGAGSLLPTLNYHLGGRIENSLGVIDDNLKKSGLSYKNVQVSIKSPEAASKVVSMNCLITSLENRKTLYARARMLGFERIVYLPPLD